VSQLSDPDHISLIYLFGLEPLLAAVRFEEAARIVQAHDEVTSRLTPHHRVHAVTLWADLDETLGRWESIRRLTARVESAVASNIATPCVMNASSLLVCALASAHLGDDAEARRLEGSADDLGFEGYGIVLDPIRVELALARGELAEVERKLAEWRPPSLWDVHGHVARLNALVALGRRTEIEEEAPALVKPGTYLEPFALRSLGYAREDDGLVERAIERFEATGLAWHAAETRRLLVSA
jgi:hypothetical protein